jgi:hypothetical protein
MTAFRFAALFVVLFVLGAAAQAQTVLRANLPPGDATPSGASFTVRMPVIYSDFELRSQEPNSAAGIVRMVTGTTEDGIRFSASEIAFVPGIAPKPMEDFMNALKQGPAAAELTDVHREQSGGTETLSFTLIDVAGGGNFFDVIRTDSAQYTLLIQFHPGQRASAAARKDEFFGSFRIGKP